MHELSIRPMSGGPVALFGEVLADVFPDRQVLGGAPFNVARHLQGFGLRPLMISRIGEDDLGASLLSEMTRLGMQTRGIQRDADRPTGKVEVIMDGAAHRFMILPDQAYDHVCPDTTAALVADAQPSLAYFGTLAQRDRQSRVALEYFLQSHRGPVFLDINLRAPWYDRAILAGSLAAADIVKLNDEELAIVADMFDLPGDTPERQAAVLLERFDLRQVLVTCGEAGSWWLDGAQLLRAGPVRSSAPVIDTVGAGDAYASVFIVGLLCGWDPAVTLHRASEYAAAICLVRGAVPDTPELQLACRRAWGMAD